MAEQRAYTITLDADDADELDLITVRVDTWIEGGVADSYTVDDLAVTISMSPRTVNVG